MTTTIKLDDNDPLVQELAEAFAATEARHRALIKHEILHVIHGGPLADNLEEVVGADTAQLLRQWAELTRRVISSSDNS
jgi:hypothetical protein